MNTLLDTFKQQEDAMVDLLTDLINLESPSNDKSALDKLGKFIASQFVDMGGEVTVLPQEHVGDFVWGKWNAEASGKPILILSHMDTVWGVGTLAERPVHSDDEGKLFGPGALDMKGGIAAAMFALRGLIARGELPADRPTWLIMTSDEETGSTQSESVIREIAAQAGLVLVTEPPTPEGALKTARKGVATYVINVEGRASHAGNHPEEGVNAILEMAQQIMKIHKLQDLRNGISVAANMIHGGSAANVIADHASAEIDVRTFTQVDMDRVNDALMNLYPHIPGAKVNVELHHMRGPMERDDQMIATFAQCSAIARANGMTVHEDTVGGGSDGNFTASMGIPTLDGLGPQGTGMHARHEHVVIRTLPRAAALMAALIRDWQFS